MVTGLGFSLPSLIYACEGLPFVVRMAVHLVIVFFLAAAVVVLAIWLGFFLYHRAEARRINEKIQERRG